jgi:hypothetical protein
MTQVFVETRLADAAQRQDGVMRSTSIHTQRNRMFYAGRI